MSDPFTFKESSMTSVQYLDLVYRVRYLIERLATSPEPDLRSELLDLANVVLNALSRASAARP
jgi:hypothetical protein